MKTITTAKKGNQAVIIDDFTIVKHSDGTFSVHQDGGANGKPADFDSAPFLEAFEVFKKEREIKRLRQIQDAEILEASRIQDLKERILKCENPVELAQEFSSYLTAVEIAKHWSDLPEGRSVRGLLISDQAGFEIMKMAITIHDIDGEFGETTNRQGEHHNTFSRMYGGLSDYQQAVKRHFNGDNFFYKSPKTEADSFLEKIEDVQESDREPIDKINDIKGLIVALEGIVPGYYDCNGNLEMSDDSLNDPNLSGYGYDVYSYSFAFRFDGYDFKKESVEDTEED